MTLGSQVVQCLEQGDQQSRLESAHEVDMQAVAAQAQIVLAADQFSGRSHGLISTPLEPQGQGAAAESAGRGADGASHIAD